MSAANPFAVAVEALGERFERLLDDRRDALHVAEIYSENRAVVEGQAVIAADALERLHVTRAALAVFERLAAFEVQVQEQGGTVEHRFFAEVWKTTQPTAYAASLLNVWQPEDADQAEVEAVAHLAAAIECRRRNEARP